MTPNLVLSGAVLHGFYTTNFKAIGKVLGHPVFGVSISNFLVFYIRKLWKNKSIKKNENVSLN